MNDLEFIQTPSKWPYRPGLPLKNRKHDKNAILIEGYGPQLFFINIFNIDSTTLKHAITQTYISYQAILDDGWYVD